MRPIIFIASAHEVEIIFENLKELSRYSDWFSLGNTHYMIYMLVSSWTFDWIMITQWVDDKLGLSIVKVNLLFVLGVAEPQTEVCTSCLHWYAKVSMNNYNE